MNHAQHTRLFSQLHAALALGLSLCITAPGFCGEPSPGKLYYISEGPKTIYRMDLADPDPQPVDFITPSHRFQLAVHECKMYWTDLDLDVIQRANMDGSGLENIIEGLGRPYAVAVDPVADKLYFTSAFNGQNAVIRKANLDGSNPQVVLPLSVQGAFHLALDVSAGKMYWSDFGGGIRRANLDGSNIESVVAASYGLSFTLDLNAGHIYWTEQFSGLGNDFIRRANLDGSNPQDVLTGLDSPGRIAVDTVGGKVYWGDYYNRVIWRANLDGTQVDQLTLSETCVHAGMSIVYGDVDAACGPPDPCPPKMNCAAVEAIYWAQTAWNNGNHDFIWRANPDGTGIEAIVQSPTSIFSIALDRQGGKVYWTVAPDCGGFQCGAQQNGQNAWRLFRANLDGSDVEPLIRFPYVHLSGSDVTGVALDSEAGKMYFTRKNWPDSSTGTMYRANLDGSGLEVFFTWQESPDPCPVLGPADMDQPALDLENGQLYFKSNTRIVRAPLDQSQPPVIIYEVSTSNTRIRDFALDLTAGKMYWLQGLGASPVLCPGQQPTLIMRANLDGSGVELVDEDEYNCQRLALDSVNQRMYRDASMSVGTGTMIRSNMADDSDQFCVIYNGMQSYNDIALLMDVPAAMPGDITDDGVVNVNDLLAVVGTWGPCPAPPTPCPADIAPAPNGDGVVNVNDLLMVIGNWS